MGLEQPPEMSEPLAVRGADVSDSENRVSVWRISPKVPRPDPGRPDGVGWRTGEQPAQADTIRLQAIEQDLSKNWEKRDELNRAAERTRQN